MLNSLHKMTTVTGWEALASHLRLCCSVYSDTVHYLFRSCFIGMNRFLCKFVYVTSIDQAYSSRQKHISVSSPKSCQNLELNLSPSACVDHCIAYPSRPPQLPKPTAGWLVFSSSMTLPADIRKIQVGSWNFWIPPALWKPVTGIWPGI